MKKTLLAVLMAVLTCGSMFAQYPYTGGGLSFLTNSSPADTDQLQYGAAQIRAFKAAVQAWAGASFNLTTGALLPGVVQLANLAPSVTNLFGTNNTIIVTNVYNTTAGMVLLANDGQDALVLTTNAYTSLFVNQSNPSIPSNGYGHIIIEYDVQFNALGPQNVSNYGFYNMATLVGSSITTNSQVLFPNPTLVNQHYCNVVTGGQTSPTTVDLRVYQGRSIGSETVASQLLGARVYGSTQ